jgi:F-type H+-transporting ATPase subunit delta
VQVNLSAATGDMGILANHVPSIEPLRPGLVEVIESAGSSKKWFGETAVIFDFSVLISTWFIVSGGFATVHPNNKLTINAIEAAPLEDFSSEVRARHPMDSPKMENS